MADHPLTDAMRQLREESIIKEQADRLRRGEQARQETERYKKIIEDTQPRK